MPGGLVLPRMAPDAFSRFRTYLLYGSDFIRYADHKEENTEKHRLEGFGQYNFPVGLAMGLGGQYLRGHDMRGNGDSTELDEYETSLVKLALSYAIGDRFKLRGAYGYFDVDYLADRNRDRDRDRVDNAVRATLFIKISPKTSLFTDYRFIDVNYDIEVHSDSREHNLAAGWRYAITGKSRGRLQAGYSVKDFADPTIDNSEEISFGLQMGHNFTPKTGVQLDGFRRTRETSITSTDYIVTSHLAAVLNHQLG